MDIQSNMDMYNKILDSIERIKPTTPEALAGVGSYNAPYNCGCFLEI